MEPRDLIVNERHVAPTTYTYYLKSRDNRQDAITRDQSLRNVLPPTRATLDAAPFSSPDKSHVLVISDRSFHRK
jgi:hypothetical protein